MAPLCGPHHVASLHDDPVDDPSKQPQCRWRTSTLNKRSNLWPKNTSTYHRPPLNIRSDIFDEHIYRSEVDNSDNSDSGDNTTVVIGSVVGVVLLIAVFGIITCCCLASRKAKRCRQRKKICCGDKEKDKEKKKCKDKKDKKDKDKKKKKKKPYVGLPSGTWQQVNDWNTHHTAQGGIGALNQPDPAYYRSAGVGWQMGPGNEMDAPQNNYGF